MADATRMTLTEHLAELRSRIIRSLVVVTLCTLLCFGLAYDASKQILKAPLDALDPNTSNVFAKYNPVVARLRPYIAKGADPQSVGLHAMTAMEVFTVKFKLAVLCGFLLGAPYVLYQAWAFIGAGLTGRERRAVLRYLPLSILLFAAGVAFAYFIAIPIALLFLLSVDPDVKPVLMYRPYFTMVVTSVGLFGLAFQMPLVAMALARVGIVPARTLAKNRRYAIVAMFVIGAMLTPPEPFSQCLLALPLIGLYELGVLLAKVAEKPVEDEEPGGE